MSQHGKSGGSFSGGSHERPKPGENLPSKPLLQPSRGGLRAVLFSREIHPARPWVRRKLRCVPSLGLQLLFLVLASSGHGANVRDFGAKGDGVADDTDAIRTAIEQAADGVVEFPRGHYRLTRSIEIVLGESGPLGLAGRGGSARVIMAGEGPAFRFVGSKDRGSAEPASIKPVTWEKERMPLIDGLEIVGAHPKADGLEIRHVMQPTLRSLLIRNVRHGIHLTSFNRNVLITGCHLYHCDIGVFLDAVNLHQIIISSSHISYCRQAGIKAEGSEIRNLQITGNDIEYNCDPQSSEPAADIWFDSSRKGSVGEVTIASNTIQAVRSPGGTNIRFTGRGGDSGPNERRGSISITGNHIGSQEVNIRLDRAHGVSIAGNTFMRGHDRHLVFDDSASVIVSGNLFDQYEGDFQRYTPAMQGGIEIRRSKNIILSDNLIDGAEGGTVEAGGAVSVVESREVTISGLQVMRPKFRGLYIDRSARVRVSGCLVSDDDRAPRLRVGIELTGACPGTVVRDNSVAAGTDGDIVNRATGVVVEGSPGGAPAVGR